MLSHAYFAEPPIRLPEKLAKNKEDRESLWAVVYPVILTTHRREATRECPVAMINQKVRAANEVPPGKFIVFDEDTLTRATNSGYIATLAENARKWRMAFRKGIPVANAHWHPEARLIKPPKQESAQAKEGD